MGRGTTSGSNRRQSVTRAISLAPQLDEAIERARAAEPRSSWIARACREQLAREALDPCACRAGLCRTEHCADCADTLAL